MKIALLPGGFKPPHLGHYNMAKYLADFADSVIVRIGQKERDGIGAPLALEVWNFYKEFDPDPRAKKLTISVASSPSPVKDVYDFVENIAPEGSTVILGLGEKDASDGRYNSIPKFAEPRNIKAEIELVPPQAGGISGTRMREIIKANDKAEFFKYIPDYLPEEIKEEIWTKLVDTTMPSDINEGITDYIPTLNKIKDLSKSLYSTKHLPQGPPENRTPEEEKEYRDILDNKRDAFRHILASAYFSTKLGNTITKGAGEFVEFIGALKNKLKGGAFDSGWAMDTANNKIGLELGKKNPNASLDEFTSLVQNIIDKGEFYTSDGNTLHKNLSEFMGGTMNKQEMAKHLANMKKLRKFSSKQDDQMVPVPTDLTKGLRRKLYEGRYDQEATRLSRYLVNMFKAEFGNLYTSPRGDTGEEWDWPEQGTITTSKGEGLDFDFDFQFIPSKYDKKNQLKGLLPFIVKGEGDGDGLEVIIIYEPKAFADDPKNWNDLVAEIKDTVRHEMEHVAQGLLGTKGVTLTGKKQGKGFKYYTAPEEIPAFVQGLYKQAKTRKIPFSQMVDKFLDERELEFNNEKEIEKVKQIWTDYARKNLPKAQLENFPPYKANQVQQTRYKASDTFTNDRKKAKKLGYLEEAGIDKVELMKGMEVEKEHTDDPKIALKIALDHLAEDPKYYTKLATLGLEEMKLFSKEWWSEVIMEELLNEGGAAGHMAHPFDLPNVNTGKDLIKSFEQAADSLKKTPGSVKIDGVNASIRLINNAGKRQFAMDRGSKKELDLRGVTKADLEARFGAGHGMIKAGSDVLDIFNNAIPSIQEELEALGMWDNPNVMFNMEYVSGKSNVQDYGKNFLAIHGLLEVETKETEGARGTLVKRVTSEKNFAQSDMDELLKKLEPFAKKKGFEIYGSVPTTFTKNPDFKSALGTNYTIDFAEGDQTKSLAQWLNGVTSIPKTDRLKMNVNGAVKDVGALSKQVYFAVFGGENVDDLFDSEQDVQKAIQGATTYLATEKLGDAILDVLDSPMGSVNDHEGVVIRDPKISNRPFKVTGKFITGGVSSQFQQK